MNCGEVGMSFEQSLQRGDFVWKTEVVGSNVDDWGSKQGISTMGKEVRKVTVMQKFSSFTTTGLG